jgi:hypothetical protein
MLNKSCVMMFLFTTVFVSMAAFASQAAPASNKIAFAAEAATALNPSQGEPAMVLDHAQAAPVLSCTQVVCDTTAQDCTPQGCGTCHRRSGEIFGHCSDVP